MRRWLCIGLLSWAAWADTPPPAYVEFAVDPPGARVSVVLTGSQGKAELKRVQNNVFELPQAFWRASEGQEFEFIVDAPGYATQNFKASQQLLLSSKRYPQQGLLCLAPSRLDTWLGQTARTNRGVAVFGAVLMAGVALTGCTWVLYALNRQKRLNLAQRVLALGGDPSEPMIGPFIPLKVLGQGGFGLVHKAVHRDQLWQPQPGFAAVKTILASQLEESGEGESFRKRFLREAHALERLEHRHVVRLLHYSLDGDKPYIAMEFVNGITFQQLIAQNPQGMQPEKAVSLMLPVLEALEYAHGQSQPILHRDIKPENLMLDSQGVVKVMDFGLAHRSDQSRMTDGNFVGTLQYSPLEALEANQQPATDQFAAGLVLQELLTGRAANPHGDPMQALNTLISGKLPRLQEQRSDLGELAAIVDRMTAARPEGRFPSVAEARRQLEQWQAQRNSLPHS